MTLNTNQRIVLGGLGAMMPVLLNLIVIDFNSIVTQYSFVSCVGYLVRTAALFGIGGLVGYFHTSEKVPFKLFQLGIGAPALFVALVNGTHVPSPSQPDPKAPQAAVISFVSSAYAATAESKRYSLPEMSVTRQFWHGFTGRPVTHVWFVVADDNLDLPTANARIAAIRSKHPDLQTQLYYMWGQDNRYAVVIGENMEQADADALAARVRSSDDLKQAKEWKLPSR